GPRSSWRRIAWRSASAAARRSASAGRAARAAATAQLRPSWPKRGMRPGKMRFEVPVNSIGVARLYEDQREELQLELLSESLASRAEITVSDINRPGMALMGFVENFLPERIQILAQTELTYLATLSPHLVREALDGLFRFNMPLIVVCKGLEIPPYLIQRANECQVPVLRTPLSTTPFIHSLTAYLDHMFAPSTTVHGSLVDV